MYCNRQCRKRQQEQAVVSDISYAATASVSKAASKITSDSRNSIVKEALPDFTATYSGFVGNDTRDTVIETDARYLYDGEC